MIDVKIVILLNVLRNVTYLLPTMAGYPAMSTLLFGRVFQKIRPLK